jgi:hypothetical protein
MPGIVTLRTATGGELWLVRDKVSKHLFLAFRPGFQMMYGVLDNDRETREKLRKILKRLDREAKRGKH